MARSTTCVVSADWCRASVAPGQRPSGAEVRTPRHRSAASGTSSRSRTVQPGWARGPGGRATPSASSSSLRGCEREALTACPCQQFLTAQLFQGDV